MDVLRITIRKERDEKWPVVVERQLAGNLGEDEIDDVLKFPTVNYAEQLLQLTLEPQAYGEYLGRALFTGKVRGIFERSLRGPRRVILDVEDVELRKLAWHRLCYPADGGTWKFVAHDQNLPFSLAWPARPEGAQRIYTRLNRSDVKALVVAASPGNLGKYKLDPFDEGAAAGAVLAGLGDIPAEVLAVEAAGSAALPTLTQITGRLSEGDIAFLHLAVHGRVKDGETMLYLSDEKGQVRPVKGQIFLDELAKIEQLPHLIFLASCQSAQEETGLGNLARRAREQLGTPAVVAMSDRVKVETAAKLAEAFYRHLAIHGEADRALVKALSSLSDGSQVTVPVLYSQLEGSLFAPDEPAEGDREALRPYLEWLMAERGTLPLRALSSGKTGDQERPPELAKIYVTLNIKTRIRPGEKWAEEIEAPLERKHESLPALAEVAANQRLILLGDPGSGKSTFVSHLAYCLAAHSLEPQGDWLKQLPGWPAEAAGYLPILVILRDFVRWLPRPLPTKAYAHHIWDFVSETLKKEKLEGVMPALKVALANGQALFLLDGLDEVTDDDQRRFVRDAVLTFARRYPKCRLLLTCRVLSYREPDPEKEEADLRLPADDYPIVELTPFDEVQRDTFVREWYRELKRQGHLPGLDESRLSQDLQQAIRRSDLQRLAGNPLLLTVMAMVHVDEGRLPDSRVLLYDKTIDLLLLRWEETKSEDEAPLLRQLLQEARRTDLDLKVRLAEIAFQVHTAAGTVTDAEQLADIGEAYLCQELGRLNKKDWGWGQRLLEIIKTRAGLLIERTPGQFAFPHRTFQEYLAGAHLATQPSFPEQALAWAQRDPGWWPMVLFAVEYLVYVTPRMYEPLKLLSLLCPEDLPNKPTDWRLVWLAGEVLSSLGLERAGDSEWGEGLAQRVRGRLVDLLEGGHLTPRERAEAANVLAALGDERPGVGAVVLQDKHLPDIEWGGIVPAGTYPYQDTTVIINRPYRLARYPITHVQFQCFAGAQDFREPEWWVGMPTQVKDWSGEEYPLQELGQQAFPLANRPRERVSWYQAVAFGRWLDHHLKLACLVASDEQIDLPHENEWEVAARYAGKGQVDQRLYPWGGEAITADQANYDQTGLGETSAVGLFPAGRQAELGLYDLSGNVWEWCRNKYGRLENTAVDQSGDTRALRGGSWFNDHYSLRAAYRYGSYPYDRDLRLGFRLVRRFPSHHDL